MDKRDIKTWGKCGLWRWTIVLKRSTGQWSGSSPSKWAGKEEVMTRVKDSQTLNVSARPSAGFLNGLHGGWPSSRVIGRLSNISQKRRRYFFQCVLRIKKSFPSGLQLSFLHVSEVRNCITFPFLNKSLAWNKDDRDCLVKHIPVWRKMNCPKMELLLLEERFCAQYSLLPRDGSCHWPMVYALRWGFWGRRKEKRFGKYSEVT